MSVVALELLEDVSPEEADEMEKCFASEPERGPGEGEEDDSAGEDEMGG